MRYNISVEKNNVPLRCVHFCLKLVCIKKTFLVKYEKNNLAVVIPAGTLDQDSGVKPKHNIYYKDKAPWYIDVCKLQQYDELPVK